MIVFYINLLIGELPDAVGLMVFGIIMVGTSVVLRRIIGGNVMNDAGETVVKERV